MQYCKMCMSQPPTKHAVVKAHKPLHVPGSCTLAPKSGSTAKSHSIALTPEASGLLTTLSFQACSNLCAFEIGDAQTSSCVQHNSVCAQCQTASVTLSIGRKWSSRLTAPEQEHVISIPPGFKTRMACMARQPITQIYLAI